MNDISSPSMLASPRGRLATLILCLSLTPAPLWGANADVGTSGASFLRMGFGSTRAMGMGRAYVALAEGTDALTWNPAGLALSQTREASYSYLRYIQDVDAPLFMGYAHPVGRTVFGANLAYLSVEGFDKRDDLGRPLDATDVAARNGFATIGAARSFWYEKMFLGASFRGVHEDNGGARRDTLVGDAGVLFKPNQILSLGFSTQNLGGGRERVGKITRLGGAVRVLELLHLSMELSKPSDNDWRVGFGGEFLLPEELLSVGQVTLRAGYYTAGDQGTLLKEDRHSLYPMVGADGISFGIGLFTSQAFGYGVGFEYALVPMGALGNADHLTLRVKF